MTKSPIQILLVFPLDEHLPSNFLEHRFIAGGKETFPVPSISFRKEGRNSFIAFGLPRLIRVRGHFDFYLLLKRLINRFYTQEFPQARHLFEWIVQQILITQTEIILTKQPAPLTFGFF